MKPLLRVVLVVDALFLLALGVLFLLTPWASLYNALQLVRAQPTLFGQAFGFVLIGLAWLALHAAFDGALTAAVGRVVSHVNWMAGVLMLVWLIGLHTPPMSGFGELIAGGIGAWLIVLGFGGVRLAAAVRRRDKALAGDAQREARSAAAPGLREPVDPRIEPYARPAGSAPFPNVAAATTPMRPGDATQPAGTAAREAARDEAAGATRPPLHG